VRNVCSAFLALSPLILLHPSAAPAQTPLIEISGANFRPMPIAVPPTVSDPSVPKARAIEFDNTLTFDLTAAGIFRVLDRNSFIADSSEGFGAAIIRFNRWLDVGAEALVKVKLSADADRLNGELHLYTVGTQREDFTASQSVAVGDARRLAHYFADALFKHFTKEPGSFETHLSYVRKAADSKQVWLSDWDGGNAVPVATDGLNVLPTVLPDGNGVAFTSFRTGKPQIYVQRPSGTPSLLVKSSQMATGIAYSRNGLKIAYSISNGENSQIFVADANGAKPKQLTDTPFFINSSPSWSPDGKKIAFVSNRGGSPQIYLMNADGTGGLKRLTFQGNYNTTPDWSPRGDLIAFTARDELGVFDLFAVNVESGKIIRLTQDQGSNEEPTFSPNGRLIIFSSTRGGPAQLYVMMPDGNNQLRLPIAAANSTTPSWGP
jgi:TolB protein